MSLCHKTSCAKSLSMGLATIKKMWFGNQQFWPAGTTAHSITISPTGATIASAGTTSDQYISVTASSNSWYVETYMSDGGDWLSGGRNINRAWYYLDPNTGITSRSGELRFLIDSQRYATFPIVQSAATPYITISPTELRDLTNSATASAITVATNIPNWGAWVTYKYPNNNWIGVTASTNPNRVNWSVTENDTGAGRSAEITVSGAGISKTINVNQLAGYTFYLSPTGETVSSAAGATTMRVYASYQGSRLAITSAVTDGLGGANVSYITSDPASYLLRIEYPQRTATTTGTLTISFGANTPNYNVKTYALTQSGAAPSDYITLTPTGFTNVASAGTNVSIHVATNASTWTANTSSSWMTLTKRTSGGNQYLDVAVSMTTSTSQRTGYINFTAGTATAQATIQQKPKVADFINISPTGYTGNNAVASAGTDVYFTVESNQTWTASTNHTWMHLTKESSTSLKVTVDATNALDVRSGTVAFNIGSVTHANATIEQKPRPYSIDGFHIYATYGDWVIGYYETGSYAGSTPIINIAIVNKVGNFYDAHSFSVSMKYTNLGNAQQTVTNQTYNIAANPNGYTINIPNGGTCNGYPIVGGQKSLDEVTFFEEI